jgi:hypothetical protein
MARHRIPLKEIREEVIRMFEEGYSEDEIARKMIPKVQGDIDWTQLNRVIGSLKGKATLRSKQRGHPLKGLLSREKTTLHILEEELLSPAH